MFESRWPMVFGRSHIIWLGVRQTGISGRLHKTVVPLAMDTQTNKNVHKKFITKQQNNNRIHVYIKRRKYVTLKIISYRQKIMSVSV